MAYPVMLGSFATTILNVTDSVFLGRIGEVELGASALGGILYFVFAMIGVSIGTGTQILIARRTGERNDAGVGPIFDHSFLLLAGISLLLFLILFVGAPVFLPYMVRNPKILAAAIAFLEYRSFGIFFIMVAAVYRSFYVGIAQPKVYGTYSFLMAGLNLLLNYTLIFGHWGFPEMGIAGSGLASSISEAVALFYLVFYTSGKRSLNIYQLFKFKSIQSSVFRSTLELSIPLIVQNLLSMGAWFIFFIFIEKIGQHELAISNMVRGAYMVSMTPIWGFAIAANSMVSNVIGQDRREEVMVLLNRIILLAFGTAAVMVAINLLFPVQLLGAFTQNQQLIEDARPSLMVVNVSMFFFAFAMVCISAVSGTGATRTALYIEIAAILLYMVYNYLVTFVFSGTVEAVWMSEIIYWVFTGLASYQFLRSSRWKAIQL